jgi:hypothetical protein
MFLWKIAILATTQSLYRTNIVARGHSWENLAKLGWKQDMKVLKIDIFLHCWLPTWTYHINLIFFYLLPYFQILPIETPKKKHSFSTIYILKKSL